MTYSDLTKLIYRFRRSGVVLGVVQCLWVLLPAAAVFPAAAGATKSFVATVQGFRADSAEVELRSDSGETTIASFTPATVVQKIAPGARDLRSAETIAITGIPVGARALVTLEEGSRNLRRIVIMPASEIARHKEAEQLEWQRSGVAGIVTRREGNRIVVKFRTFAGAGEAIVEVDEQTRFRRYAPDSVKFSDARPSRLAEVSSGDQLRARGEKSADGLHVRAREVVFGTFVMKAGVVTEVDAAAGRILASESGTRRPLRIAVTAASALKQMAGPPPMAAELNQMLERLPSVALADIRPGSTIVVSSTKGATADQLTAIVLLANAEMLLRMAAAMPGENRMERAPAPGGDTEMLSNLGIGGLLVQ